MGILDKLLVRTYDRDFIRFAIMASEIVSHEDLVFNDRDHTYSSIKPQPIIFPLDCVSLVNEYGWPIFILDTLRGPMCV
jgi:hypothetical protein